MCLKWRFLAENFQFALKFSMPIFSCKKIFTINCTRRKYLQCKPRIILSIFNLIWFSLSRPGQAILKVLINLTLLEFGL